MKVVKANQTTWSVIYKPMVEQALKNANITDKGAIRTILTFERRVNTCHTMLYSGSSWEGMSNSNAYYDAILLAEDLYDSYDKSECKYWEQWKAYCTERGYSTEANLGDFLA